MRALHVIMVVVVTVLFLLSGTGISSAAVHLSRMELRGSINPGSAAYFERALAEANRSGDELLLVELDTPGGLVSSLRSMVQQTMASRVPVVVYVSPSGAHAASAGALLLLSSHVAAMAPGTGTGAAHPVDLGGEEQQKKDSISSKKAENDVAAFARSIAEQRGRNAVWAERAVRESIASTASEALAAGVIDTVAADRAVLIAFLHGRGVKTTAGMEVLQTADAEIRVITPTFRERVMMVIADPNIASILMMLGIAGLYFELVNPGAIFPGVAGAIALLLGFFALQLLSVNVTGLLLVGLAMLFLLLELFVTSGGLLAIAGLVSLLIGSLMLFDVPGTGISINLWYFFPVYIAFSAAVFFLVFKVLRSSRGKVISGAEGIVGETGRVVRVIDGRTGKVFVHGELWDAVWVEPCLEGSMISVTGIEGMVLQVKLKKER